MWAESKALNDWGPRKGRNAGTNRQNINRRLRNLIGQRACHVPELILSDCVRTRVAGEIHDF